MGSSGCVRNKMTEKEILVDLLMRECQRKKTYKDV